jgi:acyl-CoA synthetase (AMP-forming)/AMP-acid ligase II
MELLPALVHRRATEHPGRMVYRFFGASKLVPRTLDWGTLDDEVTRLARHLVDRGLHGERVLVACKAQRHFIVAFLACLAAGAVAVPTPLPRRQALQERLQLIADDARAAAIAIDGDELEALPEGSRVGALPRIDLRTCAASLPPADFDALPPVSGEDLAFLQYTSGSTGDPKGVMVLHRHIVRNCAAIGGAMAITRDSAVLIALPLFHDMGLVGGVLQALVSGCNASFLPPAEFVQYPERWFEIVSRHGITISGGPNFMYELLARSAATEPPPAGTDLSTLRVAFCGAEPIRASTVDLFCRAFAPMGFDAAAFYPCYGMAESTLFITGTTVGRGARVSRRTGLDVVGCGHAGLHTRVRIVEPRTRVALPDGHVGEIWTRGDSVAAGYWQRPELTREVFEARLFDDSDRGQWLRTGDLGYLEAGELHVCGRLKDLVIVNGRKHAPQDLEQAAEAAHPALRPAGSAVFAAARDGAECAVLVCELQRDWLRRTEAWPEIERALRAGVNAAFGVVLADIAFIKPGELPRTSSGKVRRAECRARWLAGRFAPEAAPAVADEVAG